MVATVLFHAATIVVSLATFLIAATPTWALVEWSVETITTDAQTPLQRDFRRIMAAGYYDATADQTFVSFTGTNMIPHVAAYDHLSHGWGSPVSVPMQPPTTDAHDYSHIFQLGNGHIGLTTSLHDRELYFARSENPHSVDGNWTVIEIWNDLGATYPMPMVSQSDGSVSILYRETTAITDYRPIKIVRSTDNGTTWSSPWSVIDFYNTRTDYLNEIYLGAMSYEADHPSLTLGEGYHSTWTIAGGGGPQYGRQHDRFHKNMYYAFYSLADLSWYAADGTNLGSTVTNAEAEAHALVFDSGELEGRRDLGETQDIGYTSKGVLDAKGSPVVAFQNGKTNNINIAHWDGDQWNVTAPPTFWGTRSLRDLALVDDKVWLLEDHGNGSRVVELQPDGSWRTIAFYRPDTNANDDFFIDNGTPEALILSVNDNPGGGVYAVSTITADFDGDHDVDGDDLDDPVDGWEARYGVDLGGTSFLHWQRQVGIGVPELAASTTVPEQSSLLLAVLGLLTWPARRKA